MRANKRTNKIVLTAAVAMTLCSAITQVNESAAFQPIGVASRGNGETCALTVQMQNKQFRARYMQKVAQYQDGAAPKVASVEEMYQNIEPASFFPDDNEPVSNTIGVDPLSLDCLGCHDGSRASDVTINLRNDPFRRQQMQGTAKDHAIGMDYAAYASNPRDFKPVFGNSKMVFVDGKVGCLTCHDPANQERGHLVMSDRRSALCLTCHNK